MAAIKAGNLKHTEDPAGSSTSWGVSFPGSSVGLSLFQAVLLDSASSCGMNFSESDPICLSRGFSVWLFLWLCHAWGRGDKPEKQAWDRQGGTYMDPILGPSLPLSWSPRSLVTMKRTVSGTKGLSHSGIFSVYILLEREGSRDFFSFLTQLLRCSCSQG